MNPVNTYGRSINENLLENRNFRSCCWLFVCITITFLSTFAYFDFACGNLVEGAGEAVDSACMFYSAYILIGILAGACAIFALTCALLKYCCSRRRQFILIQEPINQF